jgi:hypothetical protein
MHLGPSRMILEKNLFSILAHQTRLDLDLLRESPAVYSQDTKSQTLSSGTVEAISSTMDSIRTTLAAG